MDKSFETHDDSKKRISIPSIGALGGAPPSYNDIVSTGPVLHAGPEALAEPDAGIAEIIYTPFRSIHRSGGAGGA